MKWKEYIFQLNNDDIECDQQMGTMSLYNQWQSEVNQLIKY